MKPEKNTEKGKLSLIEKLYLGILLVIFGLIVLHAPISVGLGSLWPNYALIIKSWKEILMIIALPIAFYLMHKKQRFDILKQPLILVIIGYTLLNLLLLFYQPQGLQAALAGLEINLRYLIYFCLVYLAVELFPQRKRQFVVIGIIGALFVMVFAVLQVFVLPKDILKYIGYSNATIAPYLTIDKNIAYIRINSTLRGPNPLGAYSVIILSIIVAVLCKGVIKKHDKKHIIIIAILFIGSIVALWASYSRSAWLAAGIGMALALVMTFWRKLSIKIWLVIAAVLLVAVLGFSVLGGKAAISNVILHENPADTSGLMNSNQGHVESLESSFKQAIKQPLGSGIGSTGSASLLGHNPDIIENQYLFVAHETGWLGLVLFIVIFFYILAILWQLKGGWLALGVFVSGVGLAIIGLLLPVWTDDTVSIIWWGLAAIALAGLNINSAKSNKNYKD